MLIVFEGADGTGKSTAAKWLTEVMKDHLSPEMSVEYTREPTFGTFGKAIRAKHHDPVEEAALFIADRVGHVRKVVKPMMSARSKYLIMDRYYYSTVAYQSAREHPDINVNELMADAKLFCPEPTILFLFECDVDVAMKRIIDSRGVVDEKYEVAEYQKRVQRIFRDVVPPDTQIIDTTTTGEEAVRNAVLKAVCARSASLELMLKKVVEKKYRKRLTRLANGLQLKRDH